MQVFSHFMAPPARSWKISWPQKAGAGEELVLVRGQVHVRAIKVSAFVPDRPNKGASLN